MPLTRFICTDRQTIACQDCLEACRLNGRCISKSTLRSIWETERVWDGKPHVTDLLNGTMYSYLRITQEYPVEPQSRAFALLGSVHHKLMEKAAEYPAEVHVEVMGIQGTCDSLESLPGGWWEIVDYKTWGAYKVAKAIGLEEAGKQPDPSGAVYLKSGAWGRAGSPKMVTTYRANPNKADLTNEALQLNFYRIGIESGGMDVKKLTIQATVRDGGTISAKGYGVGQLVYMISVPMLDNGGVMEILLDKKEALLEAMRSNAPELCSDEECWGGRRCASYCDVWNHCSRGRELRKGG